MNHPDSSAESFIVKSIVLKRNSGNCFLNFEDGTAVIISKDIILKYGIGKKTVVNNELLTLISKEQRIIELKQIAYNYASYKLRTEKQIYTHLTKKGFDKSEIALAINFLTDFNLVDDEKYAIAYLKDFLLRKNTSELKIRMELIAKGVEKDLARKVTNQYYPKENTYELAFKAAEKKLRILAGKSAEKQKNSLTSFLLRNGFEWDIVKKVVSELLNMNN